MCRCLIAVALLGVFAVSPPAIAAAPAWAVEGDRQDQDRGPRIVSDAALPLSLSPIDVDRLVVTIGPISFGRGVAAQQVPVDRESLTSRVLITSLYVTTAVTQGLDAHSTFKAIDAGAVETNPLLKSLVKHRAAFVALKMGIAAGLIYAGHHLYKKNKVAGALALIGVNVAYGLIALRNYDVAREQRAINGR